MTKICHITSVHTRYDTRIFHKECSSLARAGYDVTLLVAEKPGSHSVCEKKNGVAIVPVAFNPKNRVERIKKASSVMGKAAAEVSADIYHFHDPELLPLALKIKCAGKKVIFDSHEDVAAQIMEKSWIPAALRPIIAGSYYLYARRALKEMDYLIGVTPSLVEKLKRINKKTEMITNYPIIDNKQLRDVAPRIKAKSFAFAGGICENWTHETILDALLKTDATYTLMGSGDDEYISRLKRHPAWSKVKFYGRVPHEKVADIMSCCLAGLAMLNYSLNSGGRLGTLGNTKLFEYMAIGLPLICTDFILWGRIIEKWQCGICVPPCDADALAKAMQYLLDNPDIAKQMGENGRRAVLEEFNWGIEEKKLLGLYEKVAR